MEQRLITIICAFLMSAIVTNAQDSTTSFVNLKGVEITEKRATAQSKYPRTHEKHQNLSSFIDNNTGAFIKYNGPVGVNSVSIGGLPGQHTAIRWNDMNLQSAMNGFSDLNLIPIFLFDEVKVTTDFGDQPFGGGLGGSVSLNTHYARNEALYSFGSFNNHKIGLAVNPVNGDKLKVGFRFFHSYGENDFAYTDAFGQLKYLDNAGMRQTHFLPSISYKINQKSQVTSELWVMNAKRGVPPTLFESIGTATQGDRNIRSVTSFYHNVFNDNKSRSFTAKLALLDEKIIYDDTLRNIFGDNHAQTANLIVRQGFSKVNYVTDVTTSLFLGANAGFSETQTLNYAEAMTFNNVSAQARFQQAGFAGRWLYNVNVKAENFLGQTPYSLDANFKYRFKEKTHLDVFAGKAYRFPTFNDLYWQPGGNSELQTENAYKAHAQLSTSLKYEWRLWGQVHSALVDNWIMWLPNESGVWEAQNVKTVWARGFDLNIEKNRYLWRTWLSGKLNYSFNRTENLDGSVNVIEGSQLSYIPKHKANFELSSTIRHWQILWQHQYVGKRFINSDNSEYLTSYQLDNISILRYWNDFQVSFAINNVFNRVYESTANYPMPGRNFNISIRYNFNKHIK